MCLVRHLNTNKFRFDLSFGHYTISQLICKFVFQYILFYSFPSPTPSRSIPCTYILSFMFFLPQSKNQTKQTQYSLLQVALLLLSLRLPWSMVDRASVTLLKKTDFSSASRYKWQISSLLWVCKRRLHTCFLAAQTQTITEKLY